MERLACIYKLQVMTPMEVMESQVEPMLTLTTDDDINWMGVTASPLPGASLPSQAEIKDTESGNATGISSKRFSYSAIFF